MYVSSYVFWRLHQKSSSPHQFGWMVVDQAWRVQRSAGPSPLQLVWHGPSGSPHTARIALLPLMTQYAALNSYRVRYVESESELRGCLRWLASSACGCAAESVGAWRLLWCQRDSVVLLPVAVRLHPGTGRVFVVKTNAQSACLWPSISTR